MEMNELKTKSAQELRALVGGEREKLRQFRFDLAAGKVKNVRAVRVTRKAIARALTVLTTTHA